MECLAVNLFLFFIGLLGKEIVEGKKKRGNTL